MRKANPSFWKTESSIRFLVQTFQRILRDLNTVPREFGGPEGSFVPQGLGVSSIDASDEPDTDDPEGMEKLFSAQQELQRLPPEQKEKRIEVLKRIDTLKHAIRIQTNELLRNPCADPDSLESDTWSNPVLRWVLHNA